MSSNPSPAADEKGRVLTDLWKKYEALTKEDRPQDEAALLSQIKEEATRKHLSVDFYDAAKLYVETVTRRDWKQRDAARQQLAKDVKAFDDPLITYLWMGDFNGGGTPERWTYVNQHKEGLSGNNPYLHRGISALMGGKLGRFIRSDYEYVLWHMMYNRSYNYQVDRSVQDALEKELGGRYPGAPYLEYYQIQLYPAEQKEKPLREFLSRNEGTALALFPRAALLNIEKSNLDRASAPHGKYRELYDRCLTFQKDRKAFKGDEAYIASAPFTVSSLMEALTAKKVYPVVEGGDILVIFRNTEKARVELTTSGLKRNKTLYKWTAENPARSFYVRDTVRIALPKLPDGNYQIITTAGEDSNRTGYSQHRLSISLREEEAGSCVYVADYRTGKPLEKARLILWKGSESVSSETVKLDGFTLLPAKFRKKIADDDIVWSISAETGSGTSLMASDPLYVDSYVPRYDYGYSNDRTYCNIYKDKGAYNPGDTLHFKAILYHGNLIDKTGIVAGEKITAALYDTESKEVGKLSLTTNEFGSVSGQFFLPKDRRNGQFCLRLRSDGGTLAYEYFTVDEFVLPTFTLAFDVDDKLHMPGDSVTVSGRLQSYSGHGLTGTSLKARVLRYSDVVLEEEKSPEADGTFQFTFLARESGHYQMEVLATDATGETQSFHTGLYVSDRLTVSVDVENAADGAFTTLDEKNARSLGIRRYNFFPYYDHHILSGDTARVRMDVRNNENETVSAPVQWTLFAENGETVVLSGDAASGASFDIDLKAVPSGMYILKAFAQVKEVKNEKKCILLLLRDGETALDAPVRRVFLPGETMIAEGGEFRFGLGSADGAEWVVVTLFGKDRKVLENKMITLSGKRGEEGSMTYLTFPYKDSYPDAVRLHIFYFKYGEAISYDHQYRRIRTRLNLPLGFSRFENKLYPGHEYTFTLKTAAGVEALAAVYDKSLDAIRPNNWPVVTLREFNLRGISLSSALGRITGKDPYGADVLEEESVLDYRNSKMATKAGAAPMMLERAVMPEAMASTADEALPESVPEVTVREKFESALTFQPHLVSDAAGNLTFSFRTSDKLSTYYVAVYAHDTEMRNALVREETVVSLPVKVAVTEPRFLYEGDRYELSAAVSSIADKPVAGQLYLSVYPGEQYQGVEPISVQRVDMAVPAGGIVNHRFQVNVPRGGVETLGLKVVFVADEFYDGLFLPVKVLPAAQTLTEAHSAVLLYGQDREKLLNDLRNRFVNIGGDQASLTEITVLNMVKDAIPDKVVPNGRDVLALSEAWYMRLVASTLPGGPSLDAEADKLLERILACRNGDGGYGWFQGMSSSTVITAVLLERFAKLRDLGFDIPETGAAVHFLDHRQFSLDEPSWCGALSREQYMFIRSLYPEEAFTFEPSAKDEKKRMSEFKKYAKNYLVPSKADGRGLKGQILLKSRRLATLKNLSGSEAGTALAKAWGISFAAKTKLTASMNADLESLIQYAVEHRDGGWYYPNAVMPWRGLMESEAYAHALLCDLLAHWGNNDRAVTIADGIRLWLMLQKETQHWDEEPAYVDAIHSILQGSPAVLDTRVLALKATYTLPFEKIKAAGNGFRISRRFFRETSVQREGSEKEGDQKNTLKEIRPGDRLNVGDKIIARYEIWNQENRSFVRIDAFREAALQPVQQLSGHLWSFLPSMRAGSFWFAPQGYRNVKSDRTEFYFDAYPEENTTLTEEFFVTQAGTFTAPVLTIESLYAPHYRANSTSTGKMEVSAK